MMCDERPLIQLSQLLADTAESGQPATSGMTAMALHEKRKTARYFVAIPARIRIGTQTKQYGQNILVAETINISAGGALFHTDCRVDCRIPEGTCVSVDLNFDRLGRAKDYVRCQTVVINIIGRVLRNGPAGLSIAFDSEFRMVSYDKTA